MLHATSDDTLEQQLYLMLYVLNLQNIHNILEQFSNIHVNQRNIY